MEITKILKELGLKDNEIKIYSMALSLGALPASILGKKTGISRSNTQYICGKLVEKGLLNYIETLHGNVYSPENPDKILSMLNREYTKIDKKMEKAKSIIPNLYDMMNDSISVSKVKFFSGVDGIKDMFEDVLLDKNDVHGCIMYGERINAEIKDFLKNYYIPKRHQLNMKAYAIINSGETMHQSPIVSEHVNRETLIIPYHLYPIEICIQIYGDKVAFYSYKDDDLTGVIIHNKNMAQTHLSLFNFIWNIGKSKISL